MNEQDAKWLEQEDVLDRYVLGRLTIEERRRLEQLLASDPDAGEDLALTQAIIAAVRQQGRVDLKERLKNQLRSDGPVLHLIEGGATPRSIRPRLLKVAAAILIVAGLSYLVYRVVYRTPETPVAEESVKEKASPVQLPTSAESGAEKPKPSEESAAKGPLAKKSTGKGTIVTRPQTYSAPAETIPAKHSQRFRAEGLLMPRTIELPLTLIRESRAIESRLRFKNPVDLSAVNIKPMQEEKGGRLLWFYIHFDQDVLSVYLDNTRYTSYFKEPRLEVSAERLVLWTDGYEYRIDLTGPEKFRKAVLHEKADAR
jgi:hypothetical protein